VSVLIEAILPRIVAWHVDFRKVILEPSQQITPGIPLLQSLLDKIQGCSKRKWDVTVTSRFFNISIGRGTGANKDNRSLGLLSHAVILSV